MFHILLFTLILSVPYSVYGGEESDRSAIPTEWVNVSFYLNSEKVLIQVPIDKKKSTFADVTAYIAAVSHHAELRLIFAGQMVTKEPMLLTEHPSAVTFNEPSDRSDLSAVLRYPIHNKTLLRDCREREYTGKKIRNSKLAWPLFPHEQNISDIQDKLPISSIKS